MGGLRITILLVAVLLTANVLAGCAGAAEGNAEWYVKEGNELINQGHYAEAIKNYDEAIRLNPQYVMTYYTRGFAYKEQGKKAEAIAEFEKFISLTDNSKWIEDAKQQIEKLSK